jgi:hypothetical protein
MTTLRRLLVAVYPIRLFLLALAVWGGAADVRAQSPVNVGYYDIAAGAGIPEQVAPIVAAGLTPVPLSNVTAADLAGLRILFVHNPNTMGYNAEYLTAVPQIKAAVEAGLVLVIHDRSFGPSPTMGSRLILPLPAGVPLPGLSKIPMGANNIGVADAATLVATGPGGTVTDLNLDNGGPSNLGFANIFLFTAPDKQSLLHNGTGSSSPVTFSYPLGLGHVIYSSIPLDMFLKGGGPNPPRCNFNNIYAPNVLAYAAKLKGLPQGLPQTTTLTVTASPAQYGGTTTLTATLMSGSAGLGCRIVNFSLNGLGVGSALTDPSGTATLLNVSIGSTGARSYAAGVRADFAAAGLLTASSGTAVLEVMKAPLNVTAEDKTKAYGAELPAFSAHYDGFVLSETPDVLEGALAFATAATQSSPGGAYAITAYGLTSNNYDITFNNGTLTITPIPLTITADDKSQRYGDAPPAFTAVYDGFIAGDDVSVLGGQLAFATPAPTSPVGSYDVTPYGATSESYIITFVAGTLTVTPAPLTVRADDQTKIYGAALLVFTARYEGLVLGETADVLGGSLHFSTDATDSSAVGNYNVTPSGLRSDNYAIGFAAGTLTVSPAALTVRAVDKTKIYGAPLPSLSASYEGFVLHERPGVLGGTLSLTTAAGAASVVGEYPIKPSGLTSTNYAITFVNGTLDVTPAPLTVRAEDTTKRYGAALPAFTAKYEGFVLGETPGVLGGNLTFTTPATVDSVVGQYPLTPSGLTSSNYTIAFVDGNVKVTPAPLKIRADNKERLIGILNPLLTVTYEGLVLGETAGNLDSRPTVSTPAVLASPAGLYPVVVTGAADANYTIEHVNGELTLSPEGRIRGEGWVDTSDARHHFVFDARETIVLGEKGSLTLRVDRASGADDVFISTSVTSVTFTNNPTVDPGGKAIADAVTVMGIGTWNGTPATFEAMAADIGEPGVGYDMVTIKIKTGLLVTTVVSTINGTLNGGNVQSNRLPGR